MRMDVAEHVFVVLFPNWGEFLGSPCWVFPVFGVFSGFSLFLYTSEPKKRSLGYLEAFFRSSGLKGDPVRVKGSRGGRGREKKREVCR